VPITSPTCAGRRIDPCDAPLVLDSVLPRYDVREYHDTPVDARPEDAMAAALALRAASDPIVAALFWLRGVPGGGLSFKAFFSRLGLEPIVATDRAFVGVGDLFGVRIAFGLWADASGDHCARLQTETRVHALNPTARWRFRVYWLVVGPFSALIRRRWLSAARHAAERGS
jgi:hypothetical protein